MFSSEDMSEEGKLDEWITNIPTGRTVLVAIHGDIRMPKNALMYAAL